MSFFDSLKGIIDSVFALLGNFLNVDLLLPFIICAVIAAVFNPHGPTRAEQLIVSFIFGSIAAYLLVLLVRGTQIDAILLGLGVFAAGLIWLFVSSRGWVWKLSSGILAALTLASILTVAGANPDGGLLSRPVAVISGGIVALFGAFQTAA